MKKQTTFNYLKKFVSTQESRPILTGIETIITENDIITLATDSHIAIKYRQPNDERLDNIHILQRLNGAFMNPQQMPNIQLIFDSLKNNSYDLSSEVVTTMIDNVTLAKSKKVVYFETEIKNMGMLLLNTNNFKKVSDMITALEKEKFVLETASIEALVKPLYFKYVKGEEIVEMLLSPMRSRN